MIYEDTKVYILCPANFHTGGAELLHQLCSQLMIFGIDAYMVYIPMTADYNSNNPVSDFYWKYHIRYTPKIEDAEKNILIVYEGITNFLYVTKKIRRILWWLSVDNYISELLSFIRRVPARDYTKRSFPKFFCFQDNNDGIEHWVQSEYARQFVSVNLNETNNIHMVEDYMNQAFLSKSEKIDLGK